MKGLILSGFFVLAGGLGTIASHADVTLVGKVPNFEYPKMQQIANQIWNYENSRYLNGMQSLAPEIHFFAFERSQESADWVAWQNDWIRQNPSVWVEWAQAGGHVPLPVTSEWVEQNINAVFPFPKQFQALHYQNTNKIQINAERTFLPFYVNNGMGIKSDTMGMGYYTMAHEMMHYTLQSMNIPENLHHCLFVLPGPKGETSLIEETVQTMINMGVVSKMVLPMGAKKEQEMHPCERLSAEDQAHAVQIISSGILHPELRYVSFSKN